MWKVTLIIGLLFAAVPFLVCWAVWRWRHRRTLQLASLIPGPPALPIIGNALIFLTKPTEVLSTITRCLEEYGDYVRVWLGPELTIAVKNPADIRLLLTSNKINAKGPLYKYMVPFIGYGILTGGPTWRGYRKIVNPSYNKKSVHKFSTIFNAEAENLVKNLRRRGPETFDIFHDVLTCTTLCVCQTLMGLSKEESINLKHLEDIKRITGRLYDHIFKTMTYWWLQIPLIYWLTGNKKKQDYMIRLIDEMAGDILEKRRSALQREEVVDEDMRSIVDRLLLSGNLTEQELKSETFALFTTSQEAAAKIAAGVLLMLAYLPDWQKKVYDEIVAVIGSSPVSESHLKELHSLDMVFKETLRYFAIAAFIQRTVEEEITINDGKITLPVGTSLIIPIHALHRDTRYWDDPLRAKPERFLPENVKKRDPNAFVPFSLGTMDCLGRVFGTTMIKTIVVHVIRSMQLEREGEMYDIPLEVAISVKSAEGYQVRFRSRNGFAMNGNHRMEN